ncbi:glycosyltransferase family 2 protein [Massilia sp. GCM10020059]|uniref:Glycosyltransferase n=1 Tax=Massilia agrisoli TaxID=2892444 RepID=A0ABS8IVL2_9BURK|nr:glycosyltransferase [Massilia agrisoli]MCC6071284.1 glycosyltransferase [Massilia agrisoli]
MVTSKKIKKVVGPKDPHHTNVAAAFNRAEFEAFGARVLAPIMSEFLGRLHATVLAASYQGIPSLFCHRAGLRILHLYTCWLAARNETLPAHVATIKTSRISALKAGFARAPELSITGIGMHLPGLDLHAVASILLDGKLTEKKGRLAPMPLHEFMKTDHEVALQIGTHLKDQSTLMARYLKELSGGSKRMLLIDSGWAGTSQLVLEHAFPEYTFEGVYFGTIGRANILGHTPGKMHGLMFNSEGFQYNREAPETAFVLHRHLIESLFEPGLPSVTHITKRDIAGPHTLPEAELLERPSCAWDEMYSVVLKAVVEAASTGPALRAKQYEHALAAITEVLVFPTPDSALIASGKFRSNDLGREGGVDPLIEPIQRFEGDCVECRINDALWPAGQAALEHKNPAMRRLAQEKLLMKSATDEKPADYFVASTDAQKSVVQKDDVAIITRTKNRPTLLRRAAESVASQSYKDLEWVIVNDGGELDDVLSVVRNSMADPSRITICHNHRSLGMEGASNAGIGCSASTWLVIHDDDDSWHTDFLKTTTNFLKANSAVYKGVITGTVLVSEEIIGDTVIEHSRHPYQEWVKTVHLAEMATGNFFAPIAFVFSRHVYERVGGYDHKLPVLGDWDFNLRFLLEADIGVISAPLAYYHHRNVGSAGAYSNSVVGGIEKHLMYNSIVRNKYIRESASNPKLSALANLVNSGYLQLDTRGRLDHVRSLAEQAIYSGSATQIARNNAYSSNDLDERWVMMCALATKLSAATNEEVCVEQLFRNYQTNGLASLGKIDLVTPPDFDDAAYLGRYPDIAHSVAMGNFKSGYLHFVHHGQHEGRLRPKK